MGRPDNGLGGKTGEKTKGLGLSAETIAKLRQVQDFAKLKQKQFNLLRLHVNSAQAQSDFNLGLQFLLKTESIKFLDQIDFNFRLQIFSDNTIAWFFLNLSVDSLISNLNKYLLECWHDPTLNYMFENMANYLHISYWIWNHTRLLPCTKPIALRFSWN